MRSSTIVLAVLLISPNISSEPLFLVKDGKANATIVIQPKIEERCKERYEMTFPGKRPLPMMTVAKELQTYLARISGAELPIEKQQADADKAAIHVGLTPFAEGLEIPFGDYDRDAYVLKRSGNQVVLVGFDDWGTEMATYDFLERVCGVRWFMPGELGEVVPKTEDIAVTELDVVEQPSYLSRMMSGIYCQVKSDPKWFRKAYTWMRRNRLRTRYEFHHNLATIVKPGTYAESNPEFFPFVGGKRLIPRKGAQADWQPCMSNPEVVKICADAARAFLDRYPGNSSFSIGVNDNYGYCDCEKCLALNGGIKYAEHGKRDYSPLYFRFANRVCEELAKTHPDKKLGGLLYCSGTITPVSFKAHKNFIGYIPNDRSRYLFDADFRKKELDLLKGWSRVCRTLGIYEWYYGSGFEVPRYYPQTMQKMLKDGYDVGVRGFYAEAYPNWGLEGPKLWMTCKILWDIDADIDGLLTDYCQKSFGPAAEPMKRYYNKLEECWVKQPLRTRDPQNFTYLRKDRAQLKVYPLPALVECEGYLQEATKLAEDESEKARIEVVRNGFLILRYYVERETIYDRLEVDRSLDPMALNELVHNLTAMHHLSSALGRHSWANIAGNPYGLHEAGGVWRFRNMEIYYSQLGDRVARALVEAEKAERGGLSECSGEELRASVAKRLAVLGEEASKIEKSGELPAAWAELQSSAQRYIKSTAIIPRMATAPKIDGKMGEAEWKGAEKLGRFEQLKKKGPAKYATNVRLGYDDQNLYAAFHCAEASMKHLLQRYQERDTAVWQDDAVELLVQRPGADHEDFYHYIINSFGAYYDAYSRDGTWNGNAKMAGSNDPAASTWTVEMAIPWKDLGGAPKAGEPWRANFCRENPEPAAEYGAGEWSSWSQSFAGFNFPTYFGILLFE